MPHYQLRTFLIYQRSAYKTTLRTDKSGLTSELFLIKKPTYIINSCLGLKFVDFKRGLVLFVKLSETIQFT